MVSIGACGTARPSSAGFPPELKISKSEVRRHEYHSLRTTTVYDALFQQPVGVSSWIDNAPVAVMSTLHELGVTAQAVTTYHSVEHRGADSRGAR